MTGNTVKDNLFGVSLQAVSSIDITNNTFTGNWPAIRTPFSTPEPSEKVVVTYNDFVSNTTGIISYDQTEVDARNNWWGASTGPAATDIDDYKNSIYNWDGYNIVPAEILTDPFLCGPFADSPASSVGGSCVTTDPSVTSNSFYTNAGKYKSIFSNFAVDFKINEFKSVSDIKVDVYRSSDSTPFATLVGKADLATYVNNLLSSDDSVGLSAPFPVSPSLTPAQRTNLSGAWVFPDVTWTPSDVPTKAIITVTGLDEDEEPVTRDAEITNFLNDGSDSQPTFESLFPDAPVEVKTPTVSIDDLGPLQCGEQELEITGSAHLETTSTFLSSRHLFVRSNGDTKVHEVLIGKNRSKDYDWSFTETYGVGTHTIEAKNMRIALFSSKVFAEDSYTFTIDDCEATEPDPDEEINPDPNNEHQFTFSGMKFHNRNGDINQDDGEERLYDWDFNMYKEVDGEWDFVASTTVNPAESSQNAGKFVFPQQQDAGTYHVCEVSQLGWTQIKQSWSGTPYHIVTDNLSPNVANEGPYCATAVYTDEKDRSKAAYFGNQHNDQNNDHQLNISGEVYVDIAIDDCDNRTECLFSKTSDKLNGWEMRLYVEDINGNWLPVATTTSASTPNGDGIYKFPTQYEAGIYHTCEVPQAGYQQGVGNWNGSGYLVNTINQSGMSDEGLYCNTYTYTDASDKSSKSHFGNAKIENPIEYAAYCGDGEVNQAWEQCEADDESGTCDLNTCQYENQCSELNLVKIDLNESDSVSFNDTLYLGSDTNPIPSGTWFNFDVAGDASAGSIANSVPGLGVERDQASQELYLAFRGGNGSGHIDRAYGAIEFLGAEVQQSTVNRTPNPQFKLENGSGVSFDDVFDVTSSTTINFDLQADTGNDGVTVGLEDVDVCEVPVSSSLEITNPAANGQVLSGTFTFEADYQDEDEDEDPIKWAIRAGSCNGTDMVGNAGASPEPHNPSSFDPVTGLFDTTVDMSTWANGPYCLVVNPQEDDGAADLRETRKFVLENEEDGEVPTDPVETMVIDGHKFDTEYEGGYLGDWVIELYNSDGVVKATTTTDDYGHFSFEVTQGTYQVKEVPQGGWEQVSVHQDFTGIAEEFCEFEVVDDSTGYHCDFVNKQTGTTDPNVPTYTIGGYKWSDSNGNGIWEMDNEAGLPDWVIELYDGEILVATSTTDQNGEYSFDILEEGTLYTVSEQQQAGWTQTAPLGYADDGETAPLAGECTYNIRNGDGVPLPDDTEGAWYNHNSEACLFGNQKDPVIPGIRPTQNSGGGGGGGSYSSSRRSDRVTLAKPEATPQVLGASTTNFCPFLIDYMQMGTENNNLEVTKLQLFLNIFKDVFGGNENPVTGTFGATTDANVKAFQAHFQTEILDPWYNRGIVPHNRPTGFVYKTTLWKINSIVCPDFAKNPEFEGEDLNSNVAIN